LKASNIVQKRRKKKKQFSEGRKEREKRDKRLRAGSLIATHFQLFRRITSSDNVDFHVDQREGRGGSWEKKEKKERRRTLMASIRKRLRSLEAFYG